MKRSKGNKEKIIKDGSNTIGRQCFQITFFVTDITSVIHAITNCDDMPTTLQISENNRVTEFQDRNSRELLKGVTIFSACSNDQPFLLPFWSYCINVYYKT